MKHNVLYECTVCFIQKKYNVLFNVKVSRNTFVFMSSAYSDAYPLCLGACLDFQQKNQINKILTKKLFSYQYQFCCMYACKIYYKQIHLRE